MSIKPLVETGSTPTLKLALVQMLPDDRESVTILPFFVSELTTVRFLEMEINRLEKSILHGHKFLERCEAIEAPPCIAEMKREHMAGRQAEIDTLKMLIETVHQSWREFEAHMQLMNDELDREDDALDEGLIDAVLGANT